MYLAISFSRLPMGVYRCRASLVKTLARELSVWNIHLFWHDMPRISDMIVGSPHKFRIFGGALSSYYPILIINPHYQKMQNQLVNFVVVRDSRSRVEKSIESTLFCGLISEICINIFY